MAEKATFTGVQVDPTAIPYGTKSIIVSGTLTPGSPGSTGVVVASLKSPCCPQPLVSREVKAQRFSRITLPLPPSMPSGDYEVELRLKNSSTGLDAAVYSQGIKVTDAPGVPAATSCTPCNDPIETVNRVIRDRTVSAAVSELLQGAAEKGISAFSDPPGPLVQTALTTLSKAFAGTDAVRAKGECCRAQILMQIAIEDASAPGAELLQAGKRARIPQAKGAKAKDENGASQQVELLKLELLQLIKPQVISPKGDLAATNLTYTAEGILISDVDVQESGTVVIAFPEEIAEGAELSREYFATSPGGSEFAHYRNIGPAQYWAAKEKAARNGVVRPKPRPPAANSVLEESAEVDSANDTPYFELRVLNGLRTTMICFLKPPAAQVRCFSWLEGEGAGCLQGEQYISCVAISVTQDDTIVSCNPTGDSGCAGFRLKPGWYTFSAPQDVTIEGCNYTLCSSSPVSAFLGTGQCCSDIYFRYKKKGNEIEVISEILYPDADNPYVEAKNNFAGMQHLLLSERDPAFLPIQQTTADGAPLRFRNLEAGAYLLFCQAPATFGSQPVQPIYPKGGRLALTIFGGQTSAVPVTVKFRTCNTAPAKLDGHIRDETGAAIPGQLVKIVNNAGCVVAASLTDANGYYSIQIYSPENVTIVAGSQQIAVSKSQIQADMQTVGTPSLPSPRASMERALQESDLAVGFRN